MFKKVISDNDIRHGSSVFSTDQRGDSEIVPPNVSFNDIHHSGVIGERMKLFRYYTGDQTGDAYSATVSITSNDATAAEDGSGPGQFTVTLTEASPTNTVIAYSVGGTATATTDYTALSGTVTIIASATTATIDVSGIIDDAIVEANETVIVTLDSISSGDSGITIDGSSNNAIVTITDDDVATVSITANDAAAAEDGSDPGQFTVTQTAVSSTNTVIAYTVTGDATPTTDYTALSGSVTITAGSTTATIDVSGIVDDVFVEANETVTVTLDSISSGDSHVTVNGAANTATVTITDDDVATVSITATDATAAEAGTNPGQFTVTQTQVSSTDTVIAYSITGTATATTDYTALSGTVTIAAGVTTAFINVSGIIDDAIVEGDETVIVTLDSISSGDSHVTINGSANVATVTITDDESSITVTAPNGSESWDLDSTESITWSSVNLTGNVKIELYKDGSLDSVLSSDEANDGTYSWAISDSLTAAADYKIRITSLVDGTVYDESDANFTLVAAASITVTVPNGGEDWTAGEEQTVTWTSTGITGNVNIKLYDDDEISLVWVWNTANDGSFSFTPDVYRISDNMKIRIESSDDSTIYDYSDADFTIALDYSPPAVSSGLVVKLDVADPDSYTNGSTKWINTVDDEEGDLTNGPDLDGTDYIASIEFDGSDDYFKLERDNSDLDSGWTINLWYSPQEYGSPTNSYIFSFGDGTAAYTGADLNLHHVIWGDPTGEIGAGGHNSANQRWEGGAGQVVVVDEWVMLTFINQNNGTLDLFVNNSRSSLPPSSTIEDTAPNDDIWVAVRGGGIQAWQGPTEGRFAQVLVYDRPLSDAEVEDLYDGDKERFGLS